MTLPASIWASSLEKSVSNVPYPWFTGRARAVKSACAKILRAGFSVASSAARFLYGVMSPASAIDNWANGDSRNFTNLIVSAMFLASFAMTRSSPPTTDTVPPGPVGISSVP